MTSLEIIRLVCPECGGALDGLRHDKVFCCTPCGLALELGGGAASRHPLLFAVGSGAFERTVGLPFWRLPLAVSLGPRGPGARTSALERERLAALDAAWVAAFFCIGSIYHGDPGFDLTDAGALPLAAADPPRGAVVNGITRTRAEAERYAELYVAERFSARGEAGEAGISVSFGGAELWVLPFGFDADAGRLTSGVTGAGYPAAIAHDLDAMLDGAGGEGAAGENRTSS
jgi:hypothetical protein